MVDSEKPFAPFALSLLGGVFILLGAVIVSMFALGVSNMGSMMGMMSGTEGMMNGGMGMTMMMMGFSSGLAVIGFVSGVLVILGSLMLYIRPSESQLWGAVILAFSLVSILGGFGGFLIGLILGVLGGIFAMTWRSPMLQNSSSNEGRTADGSPLA